VLRSFTIKTSRAVNVIYRVILNINGLRILLETSVTSRVSTPRGLLRGWLARFEDSQCGLSSTQVSTCQHWHLTGESGAICCGAQIPRSQEFSAVSAECDQTEDNWLTSRIHYKVVPSFPTSDCHRRLSKANVGRSNGSSCTFMCAKESVTVNVTWNENPPTQYPKRKSNL
jgi:hypothetical protein